MTQEEIEQSKARVASVRKREAVRLETARREGEHIKKMAKQHKRKKKRVA